MADKEEEIPGVTIPRGFIKPSVEQSIRDCRALKIVRKGYGNRMTAVVDILELGAIAWARGERLQEKILGDGK